MASPFPGMDPYLEQHWGDVHTSLITYARDQLQKVLPRDLRARAEERVVVTAPGQKRSIFPDVRVFESRRKTAGPANGAARAGVAEPLIIDLPDEPETQTFVEIREAGANGRLITALEILSPSNKRPGEPQELYLRKQQELIHARVNLVEIDLLRGGEWIVAAPQAAVAARAKATYRVVVRRGGRFMRAEYYPISLRERLPAIAVPLRPTDPDAPLDLQALLLQCYENGGYDDIDYTLAPEPPLPRADARWVDRLLKQAGYRPRRARKR